MLWIDPTPSLHPIAIAAPAPGSEGDSRLFVLNTDDDSVWALEPIGSDRLHKEASVDVGAGTNLLAAGTLGRGGGLDVAVANSNDERVGIFSYRDGAFSRGPTLSVGTHVRSLAIGRLDQAQPPVLAVGTLGGRVAIFSRSGNGGLRRIDDLSHLRSLPESIAIGRLDPDDRVDMLVGARNVVPFLGAPGGRLVARPRFGVGSVAQSLAIGDLDGERRAFAVADYQQVQVLRWSADRGLVIDRTIDPVDDPRSVAVADLFDNRADLAVSSAGGRIEILEAQDDGSFDTVAAFEGQQSLAARIVLQVLLAASLTLVAFSIARPGPGFASAAALGLRRAIRSPWRTALIAYVAYIASAVVIASLLHPHQDDVTRDLGFGESTIGDVASALLIVIAAPITEEIFFRGFIFGGLRRAMPFLFAAVISAGIWGLFHFTGPGSWGVVLQLSVFGLALAWVYERTGSIWPTIAIHAINNALAFGILTS